MVPVIHLMNHTDLQIFCFINFVFVDYFLDIFVLTCISHKNRLENESLIATPVTLELLYDFCIKNSFFIFST